MSQSPGAGAGKAPVSHNQLVSGPFMEAQEVPIHTVLKHIPEPWGFTSDHECSRVHDCIVMESV